MASGRGVSTHMPPREMLRVRLRTGLPLPWARVSVTSSSTSARPLARSSAFRAIGRVCTRDSAAHARYPVLRGRRGRGAEAGVDREEAVGGPGERGRDVEVVARDGPRDPALAVGLVELDDGDPVVAVLDHVQGAVPGEEDAVAVGQRLASEGDREALAGLRVDAPQRAGVRLDGEQVLAVRGRGDAVEV